MAPWNHNEDNDPKMQPLDFRKITGSDIEIRCREKI